MMFGNPIRTPRLTAKQRSRYTLLALLFAWPFVIGLGAILNWLSGSGFPMACLPVLWLLTVAWAIERRLTAMQ